MKLDQTPSFRKVIIPWYDSDRVCWIVVGLMTALAIFSTVGIFTALEDPRYHNFFWLPLLLLLLSTGIATSTLIRVLRRYFDRLSR